MVEGKVLDGEGEMSGRTPAVLITWELFYRACELVINAQLDKKEAIQVFNNVLKVVGNGWNKESANTTISVGDKLTVTSTNTDNMSATKSRSIEKQKNEDVDKTPAAPICDQDTFTDQYGNTCVP